MQIHVARNGQHLGQFPVEEVNRKLGDGTLSQTDLGWHEGAAGWAALSSIDGVTIPAAPATPIPPSLAPASMPSAPRPRPAQSSVGSLAPPQPVQSYEGMAIVSWILLGLTALLSIVPVIGFAAWILAFVVVPVSFILAIIILTRGGKTQGILILLTSVVVLPVFIVVAPLTSTLILGASVSEREKAQENLIAANLRALSDAKARWVAQTRVLEGARVTVAGLAPYLDGKEIKSIIGETYDPKPVGQEATATLPPTKSLASHRKGAIITAGGFSLTTDESSSSDVQTEDDVLSPAGTPQEL